jgi:hypothetical protein
VFLALWPATMGAAAEPAAKCEAKKLTSAGSYAACRLKAQAKAELKGTTPDYAKCHEQFAKKLAKAEQSAGPGVCPSEGGEASLGAAVAECTSDVSSVVAGAQGCPPAYQDRSPDEVVTDFYDAFAAEDAVAIGCNFHDDAHSIDDQGVLVGRDEIVAASLSLRDLMGDGTVTITEHLPFGDTVRTLFEIDAGWWVIEDGTATFLVEAGRIRRHTWHGLITFTGPPPE